MDPRLEVTEELAVKPYRKTIVQTAIILNVSAKTVRRMADKGNLEWSDGQITIASINRYLSQSTGKRKKEETEKEVEQKIQQHTASKPTRRQASSWVKNW